MRISEIFSGWGLILAVFGHAKDCSAWSNFSYIAKEGVAVVEGLTIPKPEAFSESVTKVSMMGAEVVDDRFTLDSPSTRIPIGLERSTDELSTVLDINLVVFRDVVIQEMKP